MGPPKIPESVDNGLENVHLKTLSILEPYLPATGPICVGPTHMLTGMKPSLRAAFTRMTGRLLRNAVTDNSMVSEDDLGLSEIGQAHCFPYFMPNEAPKLRGVFRLLAFL